MPFGVPVEPEVKSTKTGSMSRISSRRACSSASSGVRWEASSSETSGAQSASARACGSFAAVWTIARAWT